MRDLQWTYSFFLFAQNMAHILLKEKRGPCCAIRTLVFFFFSFFFLHQIIPTFLGHEILTNKTNSRLVDFYLFFFKKMSFGQTRYSNNPLLSRTSVTMTQKVKFTGFWGRILRARYLAIVRQAVKRIVVCMNIRVRWQVSYVGDDMGMMNSWGHLWRYKVL